MRSFLRLVMSVAFVALALTAGSALVSGPEQAEESIPAQLPAPMLAQASSLAADDVLPTPRCERQDERAAASRAEDASCAVVRLMETDGNGRPVTARTWVKAVYSVCPPEGMFG